MRTCLAAIACVVFAGCSSDGVTPVDPLGRIDLRTAIGAPDVTPVGLALGADGTRFVFDGDYGLYRLDGTTAVEVVAMSAMPNPGPTAPIRLPYTDLVAYAPGVFVVTAIADG